MHGPEPAKLPAAGFTRLFLIAGLLLPAGNFKGANLMSH